MIGTVVLDPIDYDEFVQTFNAPRQNIEQWTVEIMNFNKLWKTVKINILEELTFFTLKCHFEDFEENLIFDSKTFICKNCDFHVATLNVYFSKF